MHSSVDLWTQEGIKGFGVIETGTTVIGGGEITIMPAVPVVPVMPMMPVMPMVPVVPVMPMVPVVLMAGLVAGFEGSNAKFFDMQV